ncbi:hypothetical protein Tco_1159621 [Tanacetum coccineum]
MVNRAPVPKPPDYATYAYTRGGGRGSRGGRGGRGKGSGGKGKRSEGRGQISGGMGQSSYGRGQRGGWREDEILKQFNHEYMEELMLQEEEKREAEHKAQQEMNDEEALRMSLEEKARYEREDEERLREQREEEEWDRRHDYFTFPTGQRKNHMIKNHSIEISNLVLMKLKTTTCLWELVLQTKGRQLHLVRKKGNEVVEPSAEATIEPKATKKGSKRKAAFLSQEQGKIREDL